MLRVIDMFIGDTILVMGEIYFGKILLNEKLTFKKNKTIAIIVLVALSYTINYIAVKGLIKTLINFSIHILMFKHLFKLSLEKSTFLTFIYTVLLLIPEVLITSTCLKLINMTQEYYYNNFVNGVLSNIITVVIIILINYLLKEKLRRLINFKLENYKKVIVLSVLTLVCIAITFYKNFKNIEINKDFFISVGMIIVFMTILISLIKQMIINNEKTIEYDKLLEFMKTYEEEIEEQRTLRHETKNQLLTIKAKICDNEEGNNVIKYIDSILNEKIEVKQEKYAKFQYLPANGLKALFYFKTQEAETDGIDVSISIGRTVENSILYKLSTEEFKQLGRILGVYLDNAIEASKNSEDKIMGIEVYFINEKIEIIISNSYNKEEKVKVSQNGRSTKGKNRGHGLLLVKSIINSNEIFSQKTEITERIYIQKIEIKKTND